MTRHLILVKHSLPELAPGVPSRAWRLSDVGRARCAPLAERLAAYEPAVIAASAEPKATETAQLVADRLGARLEIVAGLHENDRTGVGWLGSAELAATIVRFFAEPDRRVMGNETADEAHARFSAAVRGVCERHPRGDVLIVAHGTVITLFVTRRDERPPFAFWQGLGLPSFVVLSLPNYRVQEVIDRVVAV